MAERVSSPDALAVEELKAWIIKTILARNEAQNVTSSRMDEFCNVAKFGGPNSAINMVSLASHYGLLRHTDRICAFVDYKICSKCMGLTMACDTDICVILRHQFTASGNNQVQLHSCPPQYIPHKPLFLLKPPHHGA